MADSKIEKTRITRPRSLVILAWLQILQSLGLFGYGLYRLVYFGIPEIQLEQSSTSLVFALIEVSTSGIGFILLSLPTFLIAIALLRFKSWAWLLAMSIQCLGLLVTLVGYVTHKPNYPSMILGVLLVFYLNQQDVRDAFHENNGEVTR